LWAVVVYLFIHQLSSLKGGNLPGEPQLIRVISCWLDRLDLGKGEWICMELGWARDHWGVGTNQWSRQSDHVNTTTARQLIERKTMVSIITYAIFVILLYLGTHGYPLAFTAIKFALIFNFFMFLFGLVLLPNSNILKLQLDSAWAKKAFIAKTLTFSVLILVWSGSFLWGVLNIILSFPGLLVFDKYNELKRDEEDNSKKSIASS